MSQELRAKLVAAGLSESAMATVMAVLTEYYTLREQAAKGEPTEGDKNRGFRSSIKSDREIKPRLYTPVTPFERVFNLAKDLFGGFTPSQVNRLLKVCRYKGVSVDSLVALMLQLRQENWKYGWIRTRDAVEALPYAA